MAKKILVVEDEVEIRTFFVTVLKDMKFKTIEASDGKEGLEKFLFEHPDLVLTDFNMIPMDGIQMTRKIREVDEKVPIIFITGYIQNTKEALDAGANRVIAKPIDPEVLEKTCQRLLG